MNGGKENINLLLDLYELTMGQCYFEHGQNLIATFDLFVRHFASNRSYLLACGLDDALSFLEGFHFNRDAIGYLDSLKIFSRGFLDYLRKIRFTGEVWAMREGTVFFPGEPVLRVSAPIIEAQLVESFLLNTINFQTTIASKASRVVQAADKKGVYDFSLRRTQGIDAAIKSARAAYIAGCSGTSNVLAGKLYGIPVVGTMAHSFVMSFGTELESFRVFASTFPENSILLVDTYNDIKGIENAITVAKEMAKKGLSLKGIRLDSGNLLTLSKIARKKLDSSGLKDVRIFASGNLDEFRIEELIARSAKIDYFGVGTKMGVSADAPYSDVIYKISQIVDSKGRFLPVMKLSHGKSTLPGIKQVFRIQGANGMYEKDILALEGEKIEGKKLLIKVMEKGKRIYKSPPLERIREFASENVEHLPQRYKLIRGAHRYPVEISDGLKKLTESLLRAIKKRSLQ